MFDIAWSEMLVVGAVALVVIGPKDLPKALRSVGEAVGKIKRMASEFQGQFNEAMREAELHDIKKQVEDVGGSVQAATKFDFNPIETIRNEIKGSTTTTDAAQPSTQPVSLATDVAAAAPPLPDPVIPLPEPPPPLDVSAYAPPEPAPAKTPRARKKAAASEGDEA